jgi:ankyrin repeat protein
MQAIARGDRATVATLVDAAPALACASLERGATRQHSSDFFFDEIEHHVYQGDTALHIAAASYDVSIVRELIARGGRVGATNRRGA